MILFDVSSFLQAMEGLHVALFADNPQLVPEGLQGANSHGASVVGYVIQTSHVEKNQVANDVPDEMQQSKIEGRNGSCLDERDVIVQSDTQVTNGKACAKRYFIVNAFSKEYLGESLHSYDREGRSWLITTNWAEQPDKSEKFQWYITCSSDIGSDFHFARLDYKITNVFTGHAVQDSCDDFNNVGGRSRGDCYFRHCGAFL